MKSLMVTAARNVGCNKSTRNGMRAACQYPTDENDERLLETRRGQGRPKDFHGCQECAKKIGTHTSITDKEHTLARLGCAKRPAILRVPSEQRAREVAALCDAAGIHYLLGMEPDQAEDTTDLERALHPPAPTRAEPKIGRNEICPCGSGKKFKKCHGS